MRASDRELWEVPAGSLDAGETPEEAAARECEEEIGLVPGRLERIRGLYPAPGFCDEELIFFKVYAARGRLRPTQRASRTRTRTSSRGAFTIDGARRRWWRAARSSI